MEGLMQRQTENPVGFYEGPYKFTVLLFMGFLTSFLSSLIEPAGLPVEVNSTTEGVIAIIKIFQINLTLY